MKYMLGVATATVIATVSPIALTNLLSGYLASFSVRQSFRFAQRLHSLRRPQEVHEPLGFRGAVARNDDVQILHETISAAFKVREFRFDPIERHNMEIVMLCLHLSHGGSDQ